MKLALVAPRSATSEPGSGGDRYDFELARALTARGHAIGAGVEADTQVALIDGLLFADWRPSFRARNVGLIHVPASFLSDDPGLPALEQAFFDRLDAVQFVSALTWKDTAARFSLPAQQWVAEPGAPSTSLGVSGAPRAEPGDGLLLVGVGHVLPNKRVHEAVALFRSLTELPGWRAEWLGSLTTAPQYAASVQQPPVRWRGEVSHGEVARTLARASALVSTSQYESWGLAAAEALAEGVPVFTSGPSGLRDFLGGAGHRDATEANLRRFLVDAAWRAELSAEARAAAARLPSWARCAELTAQHLEALCAP